MNSDFYYEPPSDLVFEEVKKNAIEIWETYDDEFGYATEKINKIKDLPNTRDNFMFIVSMFDSLNQMKLAYKNSPEANRQISDRLEAGGTPEEYNLFKSWTGIRSRSTSS